MLYPLRFRPIYKQMPWGGSKIGSLPGRSVPEHTGESWDITCRPKEMGVVANGAYAGRPFLGVINADREAWLGTRLAGEGDFPLLVKIIDAADDLSIQVHPDDAGALRLSGEKSGKNEIWYIMDAPPDASLVIGLKDGVTRADFAAALDAGRVEERLSRLPVKKGDVVMIPAGLVHAVTKGIMLAEIQQNCDITFRVYDYGRPGLDGRPRELHTDKALEVIDFGGRLERRAVPGLVVPNTNLNSVRIWNCSPMQPGLKAGDCVYYAANRYFALIKRLVGRKTALASNPERFTVYTCVGGFCVLKHNEIKVPLTAGDSAFVPAGLGEYTIAGGPAALLESFVPDAEADFFAPLRESGYTEEEIAKNCAVM